MTLFRPGKYNRISDLENGHVQTKLSTTLPDLIFYTKYLVFMPNLVFSRKLHGILQNKLF